MAIFANRFKSSQHRIEPHQVIANQKFYWNILLLSTATSPQSSQCVCHLPESLMTSNVDRKRCNYRCHPTTCNHESVRVTYTTSGQQNAVELECTH